MGTQRRRPMLSYVYKKLMCDAGHQILEFTPFLLASYIKSTILNTPRCIKNNQKNIRSSTLKTVMDDTKKETVFI